MNGIEKITSRITAEAEAAASAALAEAEQTASGIRADYTRKADALYASCMEKGQQELEQARQRSVRAAKLDARKDVLELKQEMITLSFETARAKLVNLPEEPYVAFLARQVGEASTAGREELIFNTADRERLGAKVTAAANALLEQRGLQPGLTLSDETRPIAGGVVMREGSIEVNCSVESLLEMNRSGLDAEVAAVLFG